MDEEYIPLSKGVEKIIDYRGKTPKKLGSDWVDTGIRTISAKNVHNGELDNIESIRCVSMDIYEKWMKDKMQRNDIFIASEGASMGESLIWESDEQIVLGQRLFAVRANTEVFNPFYLAMYMRTQEYRKELENHCTGTSVLGLSQPNLLKTKIRYIPIKRQNFIGEMYQNICNKIAVNNVINRNLADQVSAIYKSWFADFELYDGVCPDTWKTATLGDLAEVSSGKRPPMKQTDKTDDVAIPLVGAASIMGYTNEVLYESKILVTGRVGTHGVIQRFNEKCWPSDNTLVITTARYEFVYQILQGIDYASMNRGSTQPLITQGDLKKTEIIIPTVDVLDKFEVLAGGLMEQYEKNRVENIKLAELRDTLLPKLMSGELGVSEIDL